MGDKNMDDTMDLFLIRLVVIRKQVETHMQLCKSMLQQLEMGAVTSVQVSSAAAVLKAKNERYVNETHLYIEKHPSSGETSTIIDHTSMQIECDALIVEMIQTRGGQKMDNVTSKLPKIELIKFHGDVLRWHEFWDRFSSSVHNKNIRDVDKLAYLNGCLDGRAKEAIVGLSTTDSNYNIALNVLRERFGKKAVVIDAHYKELFKLAAKDKNIREVRRVINDIERHLRVLSSLGENTEGAHLRGVILEKFPEDIRRECRMLMKSEDESVPMIRKHLEHIVAARESSNPESQQTFTTEVLFTQENDNYQDYGQFRKTQLKGKPMGQRRQETNQPMKRKFGQENYSKLQQYGDNYGKRTKRSCIFCGGLHYNDECKSVISVEDRKRKLIGRCYICLNKGHRASDCRIKKACVYCGQVGLHHRALCSQNKPKTKTFQVREGGVPHGILQTAVAKIAHGGKICECRILLDTGSQRSYITTSLADKMKLPVKDKNRLLIYTFGMDKPTEVESEIVDINITTRRGQTYTIQANVMPYITDKVSCPNDFVQIDSEYDMADDGSLGERIDVLIGNDYYHTFATNQIEQHGKGLYLVNSSLGWIYSGRIQEDHIEQEMTVVTYCDCGVEKYFTKPDLPLKELPSNIKVMWELEAIGIKDSPKVTHQEEVVKHFNQTVLCKDGRYQVKWPYITYPPDLPTNFGLAVGRLRSVVQRMDKDSLKEYDETFKQQLKNGMIEVVSQREDKRSGPVHYLPHHGVRQEGKKLRVVLDASAKIKDNNSLNECLYKGPLMLEDLTALLIRFRQHRIGVTADIEKAFLQIGLQPEDRDVTRMLWIKNIDHEVTENNLLHLRFCRVPFGIISSPFLLTATIHHHLNKSDQGLVDKVAKQCYVDNLVTGTGSREEAVKLYQDTKEAFNKISMNIRDWNSNDEGFLNDIPKEFRGEDTENINILGMTWNKRKDILLLKKANKVFLTKRREEKGITKRQVLRVLASVYDPCGFLTPALLPCKVFLQDLWKTKESWDSELNRERSKEWRILEESLSQLYKYEVPRYFGKLGKEIELHCFTDASKYAYAAVLYLRTVCQQRTTVSLIMSRSRLTPLKDNDNLQIPRLELLGCLIGARMIAYVRNVLSMNFTRQVLWTDSTIVLDWIKTNKLLPPFVSRRIGEIKQNKQVEFKYVNTTLNPADAATRKEGVKKMSMWLKGPEFLRKGEEYWPNMIQTQVFAIGEGPVEPESREYQIEERNVLNKMAENRKEVIIESDKRCRSLKNNEREQVEDIGNKNSQGQMGQEDAEKETEEKIKEIQQRYYSKELAGEKTSLMLNLKLFKDDKGIMRCKGRIDKATCSYEMKYPILLPGSSEFTQKVIEETHVRNYHVGVSHTLSLVRQRFWIPKGRNEVKKVLRRCPQCIKHGGGPFKLPEMPPLPEERVTYNKPFDYIGIDYFGPIFIECGGITEKRWVCIYTCLAIRAIHMEMVRDLTAEEYLLALRRFVAVRGVPLLITSDNAPQFKLSAEVLGSSYCLEQKIRWRFIPELAPWHGGFYERLIGLVKHCLKRTLEKHVLNDNQFYTVIKEVEAVLNTRPLTYVSPDPELILRPSDFLAMGKCLTMEPSATEILDKERMSKSNLIESWKRGISIVREFENMFINQYLISLRERCHKNKESRVNVKRVPKVGETVQIKDDTANRMCWRVGKIVEVVRGKDDQIRVAKVRVGEKDYRRSIAHLYPLEVEGSDVGEENDEDLKETERANEEGPVEIDKEDEGEQIEREEIVMDKEGEGKSMQKALPRHAAERARKKITEWTKLLLINNFL